MIPYTGNIIPIEDIQLFEKIKKLIAQLPNLNLGVDENGDKIILSCHILARALAKVFPQLKVKDGLFINIFDHSWLITRYGNFIDPYPVGMYGGPILIEGSFGSPARKLYIQKKLAVKFDTQSFQKSVEKTEQVLNELLKEESMPKPKTIIHLLSEGLPLCGFSNEIPSKWDAKHSWVDADCVRNDSWNYCPQCIEKTEKRTAKKPKKNG